MTRPNQVRPDHYFDLNIQSKTDLGGHKHHTAYLDTQTGALIIESPSWDWLIDRDESVFMAEAILAWHPLEHPQRAPQPLNVKE